WRTSSLEAFRAGLRELGWEEGKGLAIEERFADGELARLPALTDELVRRKVDIILAATSAATRTAMTATKTIPIVMVDVGDPVPGSDAPANGHPQSRRPEPNVSGGGERQGGCGGGAGGCAQHGVDARDHRGRREASAPADGGGSRTRRGWRPSVVFRGAAR